MGAPPESQRYLVKDIFQFVLGKCTAFDIFHCSKLPCHTFTVLLRDRYHLLLGQFLLDRLVVAQVNLSAYDQARNPGTMMMHFWEPLLSHVFEGRWRCDREADQKHIGLRVGEGAESIVIFLASGVEKAKGVRLVANPERISKDFSSLEKEYRDTVERLSPAPSIGDASGPSDAPTKCQRSIA